ncbi:MAG: hypothetical protein IMZ61_08515 [Planctomycetes bacterium]|nr:hypothetical protein [Planctomycetota bacterium]
MADLGAAWILNILTSIVAIGSIGTLFYTLVSNRRQLKLHNFTEYTKRYQEIILHFPENINERKYRLSGLSKEARNQTLRYMRAYFDLCSEEYSLHQRRYIDSDFWSLWKSGMTVAFSKAAFKQSWSIIKKDTVFDSDFVGFVKDHMPTR